MEKKFQSLSLKLTSISLRTIEHAANISQNSLYWDVMHVKANPPMPEFRDDYSLQEVGSEWLSRAVKPSQFIHIDQSECIMCEGCVDICPWKCIHMVSTDAIDEAIGTERPGADPSDHVIFTIDEDVCTRCSLCVDRCPTGVIIKGTLAEPDSFGDTGQRDSAYGFVYGMPASQIR